MKEIARHISMKVVDMAVLVRQRRINATILCMSQFDSKHLDLVAVDGRSAWHG